MGTSISFAITAVNEHVELKRLLDQVLSFIKPEDEIIVQLDSKATPDVQKVAMEYGIGCKYHYHKIISSLNNDFSEFKNNLKKHCTREWIIFLDADEYLSDGLKNNIHEILTINKGLVDVIALPRKNTVSGLTREHIDRFKWFVDEKGYINYPDHQLRICINKPEIQWRGKVHERLDGWKKIATLPEGYDLIHPKTIERQEKQNAFYSQL
jgi:glycosyltransferase involved in cell wall biosynthesis